MARTRIVVLGGGFGGVYTALHLERLLGSSAEITLVSRENFFLSPVRSIRELKTLSSLASGFAWSAASPARPTSADAH